MANGPTPQFPLPAVSLSDLLTTLKNVVTAINGWATTELAINGNQSLCGVTSATLAKTGAGRVVTLSVVTAGSAAGYIYDASSASATTNPICTIPTTVGVTAINMTVSFGIVVAPGTGQKVSVGFS